MRSELEREISLLESDRSASDKAIRSRMDAYSKMFQGEMGKDIDEVLSGRRKVKMTFREKMKYKIRYIIDTIFRIF